MGTFKLTDLKPIPLPHEKLYYIIFERTFNDKQTVEKEMNRINMVLRRLRSKRYPEVSFFIGASETIGDFAYRTTQKSGRVGRPKVFVRGPKISPHLHIIVYGKNCAAFCDAFTKQYNISASESIARKYKCRSTKFIYYVYSQSYKYRMCGDFDFSQYFDDMYYDVYSETDDYVNKNWAHLGSKRPNRGKNRKSCLYNTYNRANATNTLF